MTNPFSSARRRAYDHIGGGARLGLGILTLGALACAKGGDAPPAGDTARTAAESTAVPAAPAASAVSTTPTDSVTPSPTTKDGAEQQKSRAATPASEAARLDSATRASARAGAKTRDTARTGAVTPAPVTRKTATDLATTKSGAATTKTGAAAAAAPTTTANRTTATTTAAKSDSTPSGGGGAAPAGGQQTASAQSDDKLTASPAAYQGWKTFHVYCYRCHGTDAMGSDLAPNLRHSVGPEGSVTHEVFVTTVKEGRLPKGMPSWKALLTDEQIENLWAYVRARSNGSLAAGRPRQAKSE